MAELPDVRFLTVAEVADIMRVSKMTVYRLVHSNDLTAVRVGRSFRVPEHAVHARQRPILQVVGERQQSDVRMIRRIGQLESHLDVLIVGPAPPPSPRPTGRRAWPGRRRGCRCHAVLRTLRRRRSGS